MFVDLAEVPRVKSLLMVLFSKVHREYETAKSQNLILVFGL